MMALATRRCSTWNKNANSLSLLRLQSPTQAKEVWVVHPQDGCLGHPPAALMISPQLGVLGFGLLVDGDIGIGVFPEGEKILIRLARGSLVAHHHLRAAELQVRKCTRHKSGYYARMVEEFLELRSSPGALARCEVRQTAHIRRVIIGEGLGRCQFVRHRGLQNINRSLRVIVV